MLGRACAVLEVWPEQQRVLYKLSAAEVCTKVLDGGAHIARPQAVLVHNSAKVGAPGAVVLLTAADSAYCILVAKRAQAQSTISICQGAAICCIMVRLMHALAHDAAAQRGGGGVLAAVSSTYRILACLSLLRLVTGLALTSRADSWQVSTILRETWQVVKHALRAAWLQ